MLELANAQIIESCHKNSSRKSELKKNTKNCLFSFFSSLKEHGLFLQVDLVLNTVLQSNIKSLSELVSWLTKQGTSKRYFKMFVQ